MCVMVSLIAESHQDAFAHQYTLALKTLIADLQSSHRKNVVAWWKLRLANFLAADQVEIKKFPKVPELQGAVHQAYCTLSLLADVFEGQLCSAAHPYATSSQVRWGV